MLVAQCKPVLPRRKECHEECPLRGQPDVEAGVAPQLIGYPLAEQAAATFRAALTIRIATMTGNIVERRVVIARIGQRP